MFIKVSKRLSNASEMGFVMLVVDHNQADHAFTGAERQDCACARTEARLKCKRQVFI